MKILALDLSKFKSVGCIYEAASGEHRFRRVNRRHRPYTICWWQKSLNGWCWK